MSSPTVLFSVNVDVTNPGQFYACCGLFELTSRLWPSSQGWFSLRNAAFTIRSVLGAPSTFVAVVESLVKTGIEGDLTAEERNELAHLESQKRSLAKQEKKLTKTNEERRSFLGERQREGALTLGDPFKLRLDWWQEAGDDVPKTFAGRQGVLRMARAMLSEVTEAVHSEAPLDYRCFLKVAQAMPRKTKKRKDVRKETDESKVEPFYFDAKRFAHALDTGFSLDVQERNIRASAAPLTELLALVGLQRFRPRQTADDKWSFEYFAWNEPMGVVAAAAIACGSVLTTDQTGFRFRLQFRDDQKRYKAFGFATPNGGQP